MQRLPGTILRTEQAGACAVEESGYGASLPAPGENIAVSPTKLLDL
jgi:hypothetical protein